MTYEEAIEILREERDWAQQLAYVNNALDLAIEALEKQIPKKPLNASNKAGICPTCGNYVCFAWHESACGDCGQVLDWSDDP